MLLVFLFESFVLYGTFSRKFYNLHRLWHYHSYRSLTTAMLLPKTTNVYLPRGQQQRWSWLERLFHGVVTVILCIQWRIITVFLVYESILPKKWDAILVLFNISLWWYNAIILSELGWVLALGKEISLTDFFGSDVTLIQLSFLLFLIHMQVYFIPFFCSAVLENPTVFMLFFILIYYKLFWVNWEKCWKQLTGIS
jgi:hypothetical protein